MNRTCCLALVALACSKPADPVQVAKHLYDPEHLLQVGVEITDQQVDTMMSEKNTMFELLYGDDCLTEPLGIDYTWFDLTVTVDELELTHTGVRRKGLIGSITDSKPSLKVKFDKFKDGQNLGDVERMTLNNAISDPTLMNECLGYGLFAKAGIAAPRCNHAQLSANGEYGGTYVHLEAVKKRFLARTFGDPDGDLYEGTMSDFRDGWFHTFEADTDDTDTDFGPIKELAAALEAPEDQLIDEVSAVLDLEEFLTFWAMEVLVAHIDGHAGNTNNYYLYRDPTDGLLHFIPWGIDAIFLDDMEIWGQSTTDVVYANGALSLTLWNHPQVRSMYKAELRRVLDEVWDEKELLAEIDRMSDLLGDESQEQARLRSFIKGRRAVMEAALAGPDPEWSEARPVPCYQTEGSATVTFDTTWASLTADPIATGTSTIDGSLQGTALDLTGGSIAGTGDDDRAVLTIAALLDDDEVQVRIELPKDKIAPGQVAIDGIEVTGSLWAGPDGEDYVAVVSPGTLTFEQAQRSAGAPIRGHFEADILTGGL